MNKLCLIIPVFIIPFSIFAADGVDGCHIQTGVTSQSRLYYTPYTEGSGSPTQWIETSAGHAGYNEVTSGRCFDDTDIPCDVYAYGTTSSVPPASAIVYSGYYSIVVTDCPIDNYVSAFFIFTALITAAILSKSGK